MQFVTLYQAMSAERWLSATGVHQSRMGNFHPNKYFNLKHLEGNIMPRQAI